MAISSSPQQPHKNDFWKILLLFISICIASALLANCTTSRKLPTLNRYHTSTAHSYAATLHI